MVDFMTGTAVHCTAVRTNSYQLNTISFRRFSIFVEPDRN